MKLEVPAIVHSITFGKHERPHPCNLKKVQVYGGMEVAHLILLVECTLENTSVSETVVLPHNYKSGPLALQYIKIVPMQSWGLGLNYSVWYVELKGLTDAHVVNKAISDLELFREKEALLLCMKHLRQYGYTEPFASLRDKAGVMWEDPILTHLYKVTVEDGDWEGAEHVMELAAQAGHLDLYLREQPVRVQWSPIEPSTTRGNQDGSWPGMRGGHQMCVDATRKALYMFGGWDGDQDLGDLWKFDLCKETWECICPDTSLVGGPCPRSCHKIALDTEEGTIYVLGRYIDHGRSIPIPSDFFSYSIDLNLWTQISSNTAVDGGPRLMYDHQMCYDVGTHCLYVFGGKVLSCTPANELGLGTYSGLYVFHTVGKQWTCLKPDYSGGPYPHLLVPRMAHNAVFHPGTHQLIILGGERDKIFLSDMVAYNVLTDETEVIANGRDKHSIPATGFTLRASLDHFTSTIYLYTGVCENTSEECRQPSHALWSYCMTTAQWACLYRSNHGLWYKKPPPTPCPRYAHQLVYDDKSHTHYMFGGNPALEKTNKIRLDDFWTLKLVRPSVEDVLRHSRHLLRRQRFRELTAVDPLEALSFLKTTLASTVDHNDQDESDQFRQLASTLFDATCSTMAPASHMERRDRMKVYNELTLYFPAHMTQPRSNLVDLVDIN